MNITIETKRLLIRPVTVDDAEAMRAIIDEILKVRPIRVLEGRFAKDNPKSGRVMEKPGMTYYGETEYTKFDGTATFPAYIYRKEF